MKKILAKTIVMIREYICLKLSIYFFNKTLLSKVKAEQAEEKLSFVSLYKEWTELYLKNLREVLFGRED